MKPIKVTQDNAAAIHAVLREVNGRAASFTITLFSEVEKVANAAEEKLAALPKAERHGATAQFVPAGPSASAYKYAAKSTRIVMERRATGWFLIGVAHAEVYPRQTEKLAVTISMAQADEIARRAISDFSVRQIEATAA